MKIYFAPMEGITGYIYRNAHSRIFGGVDTYFTPFIVANQTRNLKTRERRDALPENNTGLNIVPQILGHRVEDVIYTAESMKEMGYKEINLNLGCPSATVVTKGRGAGMLEDKVRLDNFLDELYTRLSDSELKISLKTRLGMYEEEEINALMNIYNKYPVSELIIHARVREDFYNGFPRYEAFDRALKVSKAPVIYNGDIFAPIDYDNIIKNYPEASGVMIGRGLLINPALAREIRGGDALKIDEFRAFHDEIFRSYYSEFDGNINVLHKMKELWAYWGRMFTDGNKALKQIKKARKINEYQAAVDSLCIGGF